VIFATFVFYPLVKAAILGLYITDPFGRGSIYVGPQQYLDVLSSPVVWQALRVTVSFAALTVVGGMMLGLLLALAANARLKGIAFYRLLFSAPIATSVAVASLAWLLLFNPSVGTLDYLLHLLHVPPVGWLTSPTWALPAVSLTTVWMHLGFDMLVLLAGLQAIPEELYESTRIDGAGPLRTFFRITLPLLTPSLFFIFVVSTIRAFESFGQIDLLTRGGPLGTTNVLVYSIYRDAFFNFQNGPASIQALLLFAVILLLTALQFTVLERRVVYA
jgi:sn-glycerol 3-phosphate transport system permease protein